MRGPLLHSFMLLLALVLAGCSFAIPISKQLSRDGQASSPSSAASPAASSGDPTSAIKAVIQRADEEQQQAFAQRAPTIMEDTATADYYQELVQINGDMADSGISDIKLIKIEWGQITVRGTTAEATTYETWRTTFADGSTTDDREQNNYTLIQEQGAWKIQTDDHPDQGPGPGSPPRRTPVAPGTQA